MSKGLSYLAAQRPEAMAGLLKFYGKSVKALDDKTRLLISIVTKVATGTERGLRQYAPQAIQAGASKEELLDAVLMAFPAAGLTKVLDAVHILLDMDLLPALPASGSAKASPPRAQEVDLGDADHFKAGEAQFIPTDRGTVIAYRTRGGELRLYSGKCPHAAGDLAGGTCNAETIECPVHHWKFKLETGDNIKARLAGLTRINFSLRDKRVIARFDAVES
jgi:nitrite reductase/ring-hydroxylating ferredoxin subunit/alkylhydroperoxidase/carboxymuconolactone decarboxylase family protein YurZ